MTIRGCLIWATNKLSKIKSASLDAEILLSWTLKKPKSYLYTYPERKLINRELAKYKQYISRRAKGEPVAYLIGHKEFYGLDFLVNKHVLIPRPETELLVEEVLKNKKIKRIADIGTGSGCIAIALAKNNPKLKIYATDISANALIIARKNTKKYKLKNIIFKKGNLLEPVKNMKLDAIIANMPYLSKKIYKKNYDNLKFEPKIALLAGDDGLDCYRKLFHQINKLKHPPKYIYCEINGKIIKLFYSNQCQSSPHTWACQALRELSAPHQPTPL